MSFNIALIFFGCACVVEGALIFVSGYLPKLVGVLLQAAGIAYLIASVSALFLPTVSNLITPAILLPPLVGELSLALWLLVKGVNVPKWRERVGAGFGA